jgi:hypothetical protein
LSQAVRAEDLDDSAEIPIRARVQHILTCADALDDLA